MKEGNKTYYIAINDMFCKSLFSFCRRNSFESIESFTHTSKTSRHRLLEAYMPRRRFSQVIHILW